LAAIRVAATEDAGHNRKQITTKGTKKSTEGTEGRNDDAVDTLLLNRYKYAKGAKYARGTSLPLCGIEIN